MLKHAALLTSAAALALGVAACGGSSSKTSSAAGGATSASTSSSAAGAGGAASHLAIAANPSGQLAFDKKTLSAKAGKVTITMTNMSPVGHNVTIQQGTSGSVLGSTPTFNGGSKSVTVNLKAGTYTFFCSVPGHRAGGMVGTLTVS